MSFSVGNNKDTLMEIEAILYMKNFSALKIALFYNYESADRFE